MRRVCLIVAPLLASMLLADVGLAAAQLQSGTIYGAARDDQGGLLPGVVVTLTSTDRSATFTTGEDGQYRFVGLAPGRYRLVAELPGFSKFVHEDLQVVVGAESQVPISLRVAAVAETITVSGETPIVDTKATGSATNFTQDELSKIPTSRDPWALLRTVPGVIVDRVNIAGNETGQQSNFASKGTNRNDAVWTLDGVIVTDMAAVGASPTYFDYDAFEEIQVSTAGQDLKQPTGGAGLNFVFKRGTNEFKGNFKGFYTDDNLEASNVPDELQVIGPTGQPPVTPETADHNKQISEFGFDLGGPIVRNRAWVWGSWVKQDVRLVRLSTQIDRTLLKTLSIKGNWQATQKDMVSVLWYNGAKEKFGRATGDASVEPASATWNQGNLYSDGKPHGLLKFEDSRVFSPSLFVSAKYAYYGTGFILDPVGGLDGQNTVSSRLGQTLGTTRVVRNVRPQHMVNVDGTSFLSKLGGSHDIKYGFGYRRHDTFTQTLYPGNMLQGRDNSDGVPRARVWREGRGTNRSEYVNLYIGDTFAVDRLTVSAGLRYDRQWGNALPSTTLSNAGLPDIVPGSVFDGYRTPFTWNDVLPRLAATYALDDSRKTILRANASWYVSQLDTGTVGFSNVTTNAGWAEYPWADLNGDLFVQPNEVTITARPMAFAGGFNPDDKTSGLSADSLDPGLHAPRTMSALAGIEREVVPNLAVQVSYTYTRVGDLAGNNNFNDAINLAFAPWRGVAPADYLPGTVLTGTLPDGTAYSVPTMVPNRDVITANGNGRILTNFDSLSTAYHGVEASVIKRLSNKWMMRAGFSYNNAREHFDGTPVNALGNPTPRDTDPLVEGGQVASRTGGSGSGDVFLNAKWAVNVNGLYQLPYGIDVAANLFGRQGAPNPLYRQVALGADGAQRVLVTPRIDTFRFDNLWNLDVRAAKSLRLDRFTMQITADLFNVMNENTELNRQRNLDSANFNRLTSNLSPRILRFGVRFGF